MSAGTVQSTASTLPSRPVELFAIFLVLLSCVAIGIAPSLAKLAFDGGSDSFTLVAARNLMMAGILALVIGCSRRSFQLPAKAMRRSLAMGPIYILLGVGYLGAVAYIPVNLAVLIYFLHPLLIGVVVRLIGHETVSLPRMAALCLALIGLGIAIGAHWQHLNFIGVGLALLSAIACTIMIVGNSITMKISDSLTVTFWMVLSAAVVSVCVLTFSGSVMFPITMAGWVGFFGVGLAYTVGLTAFFIAIPLLGAARATILTNIEPLLGIGFAVVLLDEHITWLQVGGMCLVFISIGITEMVRE